MSFFNSTAAPPIESSKFVFKPVHIRSFKQGELVPVQCMECMPGDKIELSTINNLRFLPLVAPVMGKYKVRVDHFAVPHRIMYPEFDTWISQQSSELWPFITGLNSLEPGSLGDYLGYPSAGAVAADYEVAAYRAMGFCMIYNEFYRDQNVVNTIGPEDGLIPGNNNANGSLLDVLQARPPGVAFERDYWTSGLPFPQKGPDVAIPIFGSDGVGTVELAPDGIGDIPTYKNEDRDGPASIGNVATTGGDASQTAGGQPAFYDPEGSLIVNGDEAGTIRALRLANALQKIYELMARGGTRFREFIRAFYGETTLDARVDVPELLGRTEQWMQTTEVLSTAQTIDGSGNDVPVGQLAGHGISTGGGSSFYYHATEHCYIYTLISVIPQNLYQDYVPRDLIRKEPFDFPMPHLQHIGEQAVTVAEIWAGYADVGGITREELDETFCYQQRYGEMKYLPSTVAGEFKTTLDFWHPGRKFNNKPLYNAEFLDARNAPTRIFADTEGDHILAEINFHINCIRKLSKYSNPDL